MLRMLAIVSHNGVASCTRRYSRQCELRHRTSGRNRNGSYQRCRKNGNNQVFIRRSDLLG